MNINNGFNVLPWYDSLEKQNSKKWYAYGQEWPLLCPQGAMLPFQFICDSAISITSTIYAINVQTGAATNLGITPTVTTVTRADATYYVVKLNSVAITSLPVGRYNLRMNTSKGYLYSEEITVINNASECIKLEYWNEDTLRFTSGEINFEDDFRFILYINSTIGKPEYEFEEELTKRLGYKFIESQTSNKLYKFAFVAPEYICDALRLVRMCDYIKLTTKYDSYNALSFAYEPKWQEQGDLAAVDVEFDTDCIIQKLESFNRRVKESFYNALLADIDEPVLFSTDTVAQYYTEYTSVPLVNGKLIRQLEAISPVELQDSFESLVLALDNQADSKQEAKKVFVSDILGLVDSVSKLFKGHYDEAGNLLWIEALSHIGINGGLTMYIDNGKISLPSLYGGLPIDNSTLVRDTNGVLMVNPDIELGGASTWDELEGKPSWIGASKPTYVYSEIKNTPDLSKYVSSDDLSKYVTLDGNETITGIKDFTKGLKIDGLPITKLQDDVIYIDSNVVIRGGLTMYYDNGEINIPSIYDGLPIDNNTLVWNEGVLMVNPDIELGGASTWDELEGKPSWIGASKPVYQYSEIENTPDLSKYVSSDDLSKYVTLGTEQTITGKKNFTTGGLFVNGKQIQYDATSGCWKLEGNLLVTGGVTMYSDGTTSGGSSAYSTLGSLLNVDDSIDASASVDRVLFQAAGSSEWITKPLSEIGGSVSGDYLPLSGGTLSGTLLSQAIAPKADNTYSFGYSNYRWAAGHFANLYVNGNAVWHSGNDGSGSGLAADILGARDYNGGSETTTLTTSIKLYEASRTDDTQVRGIYDNGWHLYLINAYIHDGTNSRTILHSGNYSSYALPLTGGTLTGPLTISGTNASTSFLNFTRDGYSYITGKTLSFGPSSDTLDRMLLITSGSATFQCDILPYTNNTYNIGAYGNYFKRIHVNSITSGANVNNLWLSGGASSDDIGVVVARSSNGTTLTELMRFNAKGIVFEAAQQGYIRVDEGKNIYLYKGVDAKSVMLGEGYFKPLAAANGLLKLGNYNSTWNGLYLKSNAINNSVIFCDESGNGITSFAGSNNGNAGIYTTGNVYLRPGCTSGSNGTISNSGIGVQINTEGKVLPSNSVVLPNNVSFQAIATGGSHTNIMYMSSNNNLVIGYGIAAISKNSYLDGYAIIFRYGSSHTEGMRMNNSGNLGIGTTSPSQKLHVAGNILATGGITMYSDRRKKTILNHVELPLKQIADAPLIEHYYNSDQDKTTHVGSIAQYWAEMNDWFCKKDEEGFYTMEIQNCALASAISIARHLERYESKTDKKIRQLKKRISQLEDELKLLKKGA